VAAAALALEDGTIYVGESFGATGTVSGEVCFNTSMTGYQEILTDPSYAGQLVTLTTAQVGNYGEVFERIGDRGFGVLLIILSLPSALPVPAPGYSTPFGILIAVLALQMIAGRTTPWLPERAARTKLHRRQQAIYQVQRRFADFVALHEQVQPEGAGRRDFPVPRQPISSALNMPLSPQQTRERANGLQLYLQKLIESPPATAEGMRVLHAFLGIGASDSDPSVIMSIPPIVRSCWPGPSYPNSGVALAMLEPTVIAQMASWSQGRR